MVKIKMEKLKVIASYVRLITWITILVPRRKAALFMSLNIICCSDFIYTN